MFNPSDITYFIEVASTSNVSRAAERLGITQPALSHSLNRMENQLGVDLFIRSKKGVRLTKAGERFLQEAKSLLQHWDVVQRSVQDEMESPSGTIKLGLHTAVAQYTLPHFLPQFFKEYPLINIQLNHGLSRLMTEEVISSKADVAIVVNPTAHPDLIIKELCRDIVTFWKAPNCVNENVLLI